MMSSIPTDHRFSQLVHTLNYGDAISSEALTIKRILEEQGFPSEIYCLHSHEKVSKECRNISEFDPQLSQNLLLHYSLGSPLNDIFRNYNLGRKFFIYHNLTPPKWFASYNYRVHQDLLNGLSELPQLASQADVLLADSGFNAEQLRSLTSSQYVLPKIELLPLPFDPHKWSVTANSGISKIISSNGCKNFLHVGRLAPNKCIEDIIKSFYFYHHKIDENSRLWLIGSDADCEIYSLELRVLVSELRLKGAVEFVGSVSDGELKAFYQSADVYICMSEHEGFCVPLLEAMHFKLPIVAFSSTAIPETLADAGVLLAEKNHALVAELLHEIVSDSTLRESLVRAGMEQVNKFSLEKFSASMLRLVSNPSSAGSVRKKLSA